MINTVLPLPPPRIVSPSPARAAGAPPPRPLAPRPRARPPRDPPTPGSSPPPTPSASREAPPPPPAGPPRPTARRPTPPRPPPRRPNVGRTLRTPLRNASERRRGGPPPSRRGIPRRTRPLRRSPGGTPAARIRGGDIFFLPRKSRLRPRLLRDDAAAAYDASRVVFLSGLLFLLFLFFFSFVRHRSARGSDAAPRRDPPRGELGAAARARDGSRPAIGNDAQERVRERVRVVFGGRRSVGRCRTIILLPLLRERPRGARISAGLATTDGAGGPRASGFRRNRIEASVVVVVRRLERGRVRGAVPAAPAPGKQPPEEPRNLRDLLPPPRARRRATTRSMRVRGRRRFIRRRHNTEPLLVPEVEYGARFHLGRLGVDARERVQRLPPHRPALAHLRLRLLEQNLALERELPQALAPEPPPPKKRPGDERHDDPGGRRTPSRPASPRTAPSSPRSPPEPPACRYIERRLHRRSNHPRAPRRPRVAPRCLRSPRRTRFSRRWRRFPARTPRTGGSPRRSRRFRRDTPRTPRRREASPG